MMKLFKGILSLAIVFAFAATFAEADGKKANCEICVTNCSTSISAGVIVDPPRDTYTSQEQFLADGGVFLNPGEEKCFEVKAGEHVIAGGYDFLEFDVETTSCTRGQKRCFCVYEFPTSNIQEVECNGMIR